MAAPCSKISDGVHRLSIKNLFDKLSPHERHYAHHLSRAAWLGSRIIMRQTSREAIDIFDWIMELHDACTGDWNSLMHRCKISKHEIQALQDYSALFLCNLGNFYGEGGKKIIPNLSENTLYRLATVSARAQELMGRIAGPLLATPPSSLGFPSEATESQYYIGNESFQQEEVDKISQLMDEHSIEPENTRLFKYVGSGKTSFTIMQASVEQDVRDLDAEVQLSRGDHAVELSRICDSLEEAKKYTANDSQQKFLAECLSSFKSGNLDAFRAAQKAWVKDLTPRIETIIGFVEPYRDPRGVRAEWEGVVCISDPDETLMLKKFVESSSSFIRLLPWANDNENDGRGPFEKNTFEAPDFTSVHALAFCASMVWEAANLPNYNDIRETCGFKNVVIANRMNANENPSNPCRFVAPLDKDTYKTCAHIVRFVTTAIHELMGHGSGKLLSETSPGQYNFDIQDPPHSPLTGKPVKSFYTLGQTWTGVFKDIGPSVEECRATLVSYYLLDNKEILSIFGYTKSTPINADDLLFNTYLQIGVEGLQALAYYNTANQAWGEAHKQGHFAIFKYLLTEGQGVLQVEYDEVSSDLLVHVDQSKIVSHGKVALEKLLCQLHVWRCTADYEHCKQLYEPLTAVDGKYVVWRQIVLSKPEPPWKFVQANTFLLQGSVEIKEYEASNQGIIQSWAERRV